jgi:pantetheine-phosphate adenylyltransferase
MKIGIFPGSFDPITKGHEDIIRRMMPLFDKIYVAIGNNGTKNYMFDLEKREQWIADTFADDSTIAVKSYTGLTVDFCREVNAKFIIRGLRNSNDFEYEKSIAQMNQMMHPDLETILVYTRPEFASISSTIIRDIIKNSGDTTPFLPSGVQL